jgi:MAP/microtubule affinity-regulating kinase
VIAGKYKVPFHMSPDCERLIKRILVIEPQKRATLTQVMEDKWYSEGFESEPKEEIKSFSLTPEQQKAVLSEMEDIGIDSERALKAVESDSYDSHAATYYLLADKLFKRKKEDQAKTQQPRERAVTQPADLSPKASKELKDTAPKEAKDQKESESQVETRKEPPSRPAPIPRPISAARVAPGGKSRRATVGVQAPATVEQLKSEINAGSSSSTTQEDKSLPPPRGARATSAAKRPAESKKEIVGASQTAAVPPPTPAALPPITRKADGSEENIMTPDQAKRQLQINDEPRSARFTLSLNTTFTKDPEQVLMDVCQALKELDIKFTPSGTVIMCEVGTLQFEFEVCKISNLAVYGLRYKRLSGSGWEYKDVLSKVISKLNL